MINEYKQVTNNKLISTGNRQCITNYNNNIYMYIHLYIMTLCDYKGTYYKQDNVLP